MVKNARGLDGYRSFRIVRAGKHGGCKTKFNAGRYKGKTPVVVARKAAKELCRIKRIRGVCTLLIVIQETTRGSKNKTYAYNCHRKKLKKPIILQEGTNNEYVVEYSIDAVPVSANNFPECRKPGQTRGRKKKRTSKKNRKSPNNIRRFLSKIFKL